MYSLIGMLVVRLLLLIAGLLVARILLLVARILLLVGLLAIRLLLLLTPQLIAGVAELMVVWLHQKTVFHARHRCPPRRPRNCRHPRQRPRPHAHNRAIHLAAVHYIAVLLAYYFAHDLLTRGDS